MKSLSAAKHKNNSFTTPDKKLHKSRLNTQSTLKLSGEMLSVQSYLYEQAHLKEEASKKEIIRLIRLAIDSVEKNKGIKELNKQLSKLLIGLRTCINQQEVSSYLIQLIQMIREVMNNQQAKQMLEFDNEKAQLMTKVHELEIQAKENQRQWELKIKDIEAQQKIKQFQEQLEKIKEAKPEKPEKNKKDDKVRDELKGQIREMQAKIQTLSEKEKKLIQLVKAVKSRGIDVEHIYKNLNLMSSKNSRMTEEESQSQEFADSSHSEFADISQLDVGQAIIKRNQKFLLD